MKTRYPSLIVKQINADAHLQANGRKVAVIFERLVVINGGLDGNGAAEEVGIAHLDARHHVGVVAGVCQLALSSQVEAVLLNIVTSAHAHAILVGIVALALVALVDEAIYQPVVGHHVAQLSLYAKVEAFGSVIRHIQARERCVHIQFALFKLCVRSYTDEQGCRHSEKFFHCVLSFSFITKKACRVTTRPPYLYI